MVHLVTQMLWPVTRPLAQWAGASQRQACRNAMAASTTLASVRREREETQEFIESLNARRSRRSGTDSRHG